VFRSSSQQCTKVSDSNTQKNLPPRLANTAAHVRQTAVGFNLCLLCQALQHCTVRGMTSWLPSLGTIVHQYSTAQYSTHQYITQLTRAQYCPGCQ
jgi:hypothetical protein